VTARLVAYALVFAAGVLAGNLLSGFVVAVACLFGGALVGYHVRTAETVCNEHC
jgi:hypothetical protein